uniref:C-type lectin domain-containing protein n=1 Tax=Erpetoichthys calabaricus TaxID=27687 RepID=A0A8C4TKH1_ERPCA
QLSSFAAYKRQLIFCCFAVTDQPGFCQNHWVPYAGHCYYIERSKKIWKEASTACHKEGAFLASIHNIEEHSFILHDKAKSFWIGMYKNIDGSWLWIDNTVVDYVNWDNGEPSRHKEECVEIFSSSGKWNNMNCNSYRGYILLYMIKKENN